ncbi:MAG: hypothetical protein M3P30_12520 [Chloroflexota bacterium]|nr:hypothetical protein [Chloroflexota bacterium]
MVIAAKPETSQPRLLVEAPFALRPENAPFRDCLPQLFDSDLELVPQLNELYELQLAFGEAQCLSRDEIRTRGAYFAQVGSEYTNHFLLCNGAPLAVSSRSSLRLKSFFKMNQFKTGYATHGLFPYRGKFHPQMIKALLNVMGLRPGMTVLDPMSGSATVPVEAATVGIHSVGIDASPFCALMGQAKARALTAPVGALAGVFAQAKAIEQELTAGGRPSVPDSIRDLVVLAYLDSRGYAERTENRTKRDLFGEILRKYSQAVDKFAKRRDELKLEIGDAQIMTGDARAIALPDESVDGVLFSPPYSFAVDYIENDLSHLQFLGHAPAKVRESMVGLRGGRGREKVATYFTDMAQILSECHRVLVSGAYCVIVVGSNTNQLMQILRTSDPGEVSIEDRLCRIGAEIGLFPVHRMIRQITGMMNVMRDEYILFLRKD